MGFVFSRFSFHIIYFPGSKNGKVDALSFMFPDTPKSSSDTCLSCLCRISCWFSLIWCLLFNKPLHSAQNLRTLLARNMREFGGIKTGSLFLRKFGHVCPDFSWPSFGRPLQNPIQLIQHSFWWLNLSQDCKDYVRSCIIRAINLKCGVY